MVTFKYFGFGGRNIAVPLVTPFAEWKDKLEEKEKL